MPKLYRVLLLLIAITCLVPVKGAFAKPPYVSIGYLQDTSTISFSQIQWNALTHIYEAFAEPIVGGNGTVNIPYGPMGGLLASCHLNSTRCILSFGGQGSSAPAWRSDISSANQANFITNIMNLVTTGDGAGNSYDGVDIDWEFPALSDKADFMTFMDNLGAALHATNGFDGKPRQLSFYTIGGYAICGVDWSTMGNYTDYCMCGGYSYGCDVYNGPLTDFGTGCGTADCVGGVTRRFDVSDSVTRLASLGYPRGKIILGFPLYGGGGTSDDQVFSTGTFNSYDTPADEANYTYGGNTIYMDTQQSFCDKMNWAFQQSPPLPGIFLWDISFAKSSAATVTAIWQVIQGGPCLTLPPTATPTITNTPTVSPTPTNTLSPTPTLTPCVNSLGTPCPTDTSTPSFVNISSPFVFPNPSNESSIPQLVVPLTAPSDIEVKVFTVSYRKVGDQLFPQVLPGAAVPLDFVHSLANGLYYLMVTTAGGNYIVKWLILN